MSRRSLRIDDGLLDRSLPQGSASFSVGGATWRSSSSSSSRSLKSRRSQQLSLSCAESLLVHTPRKQSSLSLQNSSVHSVASDASLISSLLDESSIQESTLVDTLWGLDQDVDLKESTIIPEQSTVLADRTLISSDARCPKHTLQMPSRVYCKDCEENLDRIESTYCSPSSRFKEPQGLETSIIYSRDRSRKSRTAGVLVSVWDRSATCLLSLLSLLYHHLMLHKHRDLTDVLQLWLDSCLLCVRSAAACSVSLLAHTWQVCQGLSSQLWHSGDTHGVTDRSGFDAGVARSSHAGVMSLRESTSRQKENHPSRSLCRTAGGVYAWLCRRWQQMNPSTALDRFPLRLLLVLPLLLLLFSLCWFGAAGLHSFLPAVNITQWSAMIPEVPILSSIYSSVTSQSQPAGGAEDDEAETKELQPYEEEHLFSPTPTPPTAAAGTGEEVDSAIMDESVRVIRMEQSLSALWERVEAGGQRAEQRHREILRLYTDLQQQQHQVSSPSGGQEVWLKDLLDLQLEPIRTQLEEERRSREQTRELDLMQQQNQASRLEELEHRLQSLAARTQEVQRGHDAAATESPVQIFPAAVSVGVDHQSHDALLAEVARLEAALEDVRRDLKRVSGCQVIDSIQQTVSTQVSSQVREEVRALVYGNQLAMRGGASADLPDSLLQWLSQQYVSEADLQGALASLELSILQNISQQLEQRRSDEALREAVLHTAEAREAPVTQEDVHVIVNNALRLFSQDRTGLADYALESGGGSIISTRCSQTYETKAALLSLFGIPLWYFSQSPRVVIQPDVHPGNCWAFRGSTGFLVIRLSMRILPSAFSLEHIPKSLAPSGTLRSAPRDFSVYGLEVEGQENGKLLGTYMYDEDGESLQTYPVSEENEEMFSIIEVHVLSNWGHPEYTCMYRFRVHGTPSDV